MLNTNHRDNDRRTSKYQGDTHRFLTCMDVLGHNVLLYLFFGRLSKPQYAHKTPYLRPTLNGNT